MEPVATPSGRRVRVTAATPGVGNRPVAGSRYAARDASSVISGTAARARLTGQPALAFAANSWKPASSMPGTLPTTPSSIFEIVGAPSTGRSVTVALTRIDSGGVPFSASMFDSAIAKQEAWAAAISCSGFAPGPSSNRDRNEYSPLIESPAVKVPLPPRRSPFHSAVPFAGIAASRPRVAGRTHPNAPDSRDARLHVLGV